MTGAARTRPDRSWSGRSGRGHFFGLGLLVSVCFASTGYSPRQQPDPSLAATIAIEAARIDADGDLVPDRLGDTVTVAGRATVGSRELGTEQTRAFVQDRTGGIMVFAAGGAGIAGSTSIERGDSVVFRGTIEHYRGQTQLRLLRSAVVPAAPRIPEPVELPADPSAYEGLEGMLVRATAFVKGVGGNEGGRYLLMGPRDAPEARFAAFVQHTHPSAPDLERFSVGDRVEVIGPLGQFDAAPPYAGYYQVYPRSPEDLDAVGLPRQTLWRIVLGAVAVLALAGLWLFLLRRQVTRRTRELAESEARSRESQQRLSLLLEHAPMGLWSVDRDLRFNWVEGRSIAGMAVPPDSVLGRTVQDVLSTDDPASPRLAAYYRALEGEPGHFDIEWGGRVWEVHLQPLREHGEVTGVAGAAMDVSHHREMESRLEEQTAHFRTLFEDAPEAIVVLDDQDRVVEVNPEFERTFGYTPDESVGRPINDLISVAGHEDEATELSRRVSRGERVDVETVRRRRDGTPVHVSILAKPIEVGGRRRVYGIYRDITEQKRLESQLLHSQRLDAVGRLAGGIAHDFNNILTAILGHTRLLLEDVQGDARLREDLQRIATAGERAAHLTRQLLTFSRREVVERGPVQLNAVVRETRDLLHRLIEERVQVVFELADELPVVHADPGQLQQVVMNLVINARDAMPSGGRITVSTRRVPGRVRTDPTAGPDATDHVELIVRDQGHGMTPEEETRMFEPFFTTKKSGQGTGLGLSTVYGIVEQAGGHIEVETAPGLGTTVTVRLPARQGEPAAPQPEQPGGEHRDAAPARAGGEVILLVDDERAVREVTRRILERAGYHVVAFESGQAALDHVDADRVEADLLLADIVMPGMSGFELAERLRQRDPRIQVLLMTGYAEAAADGSAREDILSKPFDAGTLLHRLRQRLASG